MWKYIGMMLGAMILTLVLTPLIKKLAFRWGAMDQPNERKIHEKMMPRMGGLAIYLSFVIVVLATQPMSRLLAGLLLGASWIIIIGILDDIKGLSPKVKLGGQILGACILVAFGYRVDFITNPFAEGLFMLGKFAIPITLLWIIGVTNAVNLIDGLDGLAAGTSGIAALTMAVVVGLEFYFHPELIGNSLMIVPLALILTGSLIGFLYYNFHPAQIFMGDTGSMFLGFTLGAMAISGLTKGATIISVFIPILILGIPILDTFFAIVRRFLNRQPIFQADKHHLHHCLLQKGLSHRQTVLIIYGINVILGASAILMTQLASEQALVLLGGIAITVLLGASRIGVTGSRQYVGAELQNRQNTLSR